MDNGEVIPGLNEDWTFAGCKLLEWVAGFVMLMIATEFFVDKPAKNAPILVCIMVGTALTLAMLRRGFPDEERGVRNFLMSKLGFAPPGIPAPACIVPVWSGAPLRELAEVKEFVELGLEEVFAPPPEEEDENDRLAI